MKSKKVVICSVLALVLVAAITGLFVTACQNKKNKEVPAPVKAKEVVSKPAIEEKPVDVFPLTGAPADDLEKLGISERRPLSIKIENSSDARPQTGINHADLIYETEVEGGETRFNCLFQSDIPSEVGPVRSARLSDIYVVPQYQGILFYSGANIQVADLIKTTGITDMSNFDGYHRVNFKYAPHNYYLTLDGVYDKIMTNTQVKLDPKYTVLHKEIEAADNKGLEKASDISIDMTPASKPSYKYDEATKKYTRSFNDTVQTDSDDVPVTTSNVVVMEAAYVESPMKDPAGSPTYDTLLSGKGKAYIFRDGYKIEGTWEATANTPPVFKDANGKDIPLAVGNAWYEVIRTDRTVTSTAS
ncbi:MAG: DUF3048 domain-containing protein [Clostridiales Family XIII bacterium]|jgi:hypothetical protein|nr:DUF3048 domain-containing protein [Clostridiales Family XIII bacterium]